MEYGVRHCVAGLPAEAFFRVYVSDDEVKVMSFMPFDFTPDMTQPDPDAPDDEPFEPAPIMPDYFVPSDVAATLLSDVDFSNFKHGQMFSAADIGAKGCSYFQLRDWYSYKHADGTNFGYHEMKGPQDWYFPVDRTGGLFQPYNKWALGSIMKDKGGSDLRRLGRSAYVQVLVPFEGTPLNECLINIVYNEKFGFWSNAEFSNRVDVATLKQTWFANFLPRLEIVGPDSVAAGEVVNLTVSILDPQTGEIMEGKTIDCYLEAVSGYLPKSRVEASPSAEFKVRALDLDPGDQMKIKVGWKNYSGVDEHVVSVT